MARILVLAMGSSGDVHPMIALTQTLRQRGHTVSCAVNPHFFPLLQKLNISQLPIGTEELYHRAMEAAELWHPTKAFPFIFRQFIIPAIREIYTLVTQQHPDLIVGTPLSIGARVAHEVHHIPYATVLLAPAPVICRHYPPSLPPLATWQPRWLSSPLIALINAYMDHLAKPGINGFRAEFGLPPEDHLITRYWHSPQLILGLFPELFLGHPRPLDWPPALHTTGFPLYDEKDASAPAPEVDAFINAGSPPIVFTPGSAMTQAHDFFRASAEAVTRLNRRALFLTRYPEQLPTQLPNNIAHFSFVPLSTILPRCAALVCHGGIGTISQGLAARIPQLVMPMAHDQPDNAARIKRLGVGLSLPRKKYRTPAVTRLLQQLIENPQFTNHAQSIGAQIRSNSRTALADACQLLEALLPNNSH